MSLKLLARFLCIVEIFVSLNCYCCKFNVIKKPIIPKKELVCEFCGTSWIFLLISAGMQLLFSHFREEMMVSLETHRFFGEKICCSASFRIIFISRMESFQGFASGFHRRKRVGIGSDAKREGNDEQDERKR